MQHFTNNTETYIAKMHKTHYTSTLTLTTSHHKLLNDVYSRYIHTWHSYMHTKQFNMCIKFNQEKRQLATEQKIS